MINVSIQLTAMTETGMSFVFAESRRVVQAGKHVDGKPYPSRAGTSTPGDESALGQ